MNKGIAQCEVIRHICPITIKIILNALPLTDRIHKLGSTLIYIQTGLTIGSEKQRSRFKRYEMAYITSNSSICVFLKDSAAISPMNPIGIIKSNLDLLESAQTGDVMIVRRIH